MADNPYMTAKDFAHYQQQIEEPMTAKDFAHYQQQIEEPMTPADFDMEVLCSLPKYPLLVPVALLAADLEQRISQPVQDALKRLKLAGYRVMTENALDGRAASIMPDGWAKARAAGEAYWAKAHQETL